MLLHWIWLSTRQGLNKRTQYELVQRLGDPEDVYRATGSAFADIPGLTEKSARVLDDKSLEEARKILDRCRSLDIHLLTLRDTGYPQRLKSIYEPPILLYYRGVLPDWRSHPMIGAVGTRSCSEYGVRVGEKLGYQLSRCGGCVVSGMAEGIDAALLSGVLSAWGTPVVFLAGGVDQVYPAENRGLYQQILHCGGCILSEQPPGVQPLKWLFPVRNRLISGISNAVLVVEAPERSGALITARHAMEQGREVYVVPGPIDSPSCKGSNALLKDGAQIVQSGWDILESYQEQYEGIRDSAMESITPEKTGNPPINVQKVTATRQNGKKVIDNKGKQPYIDVEKKPAARSPREQAVIDLLLNGPRLTDTVINDCGLPRGEALAVMTMLEIQGVLKRLPGNLISLNET